MLSFVVWGVPAPQGSMKAFNVKGRRFPIVTADNQRTRPWKQSVQAEAFLAKGGEHVPCIVAPVAVEVLFFLPRPKTAPKTVRRPAKKPDLDKLVRAILDALTDAGIWLDDGQVVSIQAKKVFAGGQDDPVVNGIPRAAITILPA